MEQFFWWVVVGGLTGKAAEKLTPQALLLMGFVLLGISYVLYHTSKPLWSAIK
jgi:hypothetical protein